jgi:hypothetical protein
MELTVTPPETGTGLVASTFQVLPESELTIVRIVREPLEPSAAGLFWLSLSNWMRADPFEPVGVEGQPTRRWSVGTGSSEVDHVRPPSVEWTTEFTPAAESAGE